jgi:hypothetical protein
VSLSNLVYFRRQLNFASAFLFVPSSDAVTKSSVSIGRNVCTDVFKVIVKLGEPLIVGKSNFEVSCAPNQGFDSEANVEVRTAATASLGQITFNLENSDFTLSYKSGESENPPTIKIVPITPPCHI